MNEQTYAFARGADYASTVKASERVAWKVDEVFGDRHFDASREIIPASWTGTEGLEFLTPDEHRTLNHIRAFSYPHLFGNYEEFIPISLAEIVQESWHDDRMRLRALSRFSEEEMKHQQLFLRAEQELEDACGYMFDRYFDPGKQRVTAFTNAVLEFPLLPRFLLLTAFEWGSQRHYVDSIRDRDGDRSDPLYVDMLKVHWIEENQHTKTDVLEIARMAENLTQAERAVAFDQMQGIAALVDETFVGQTECELATFLRVTKCALSEAQRALLGERLLETMRIIWADVSLTHPSFTKMALELSEKGAAKLGITPR